MSSTLKMCSGVFRSRSMWSSSTRLMGDKTPSTGIPCSEKAECPKPCQEKKPTVCKKEEANEEEEAYEEEEAHEEEEAYEEECPQKDQIDVPGLSKAVLCVPEGEVGPGASKCGKYKNPEYFSYNRTSYHEAEVEMACYRNAQPSAKAKKTNEPECSEQS